MRRRRPAAPPPSRTSRTSRTSPALRRRRTGRRPTDGSSPLRVVAATPEFVFHLQAVRKERDDLGERDERVDGVACEEGGIGPAVQKPLIDAIGHQPIEHDALARDEYDGGTEDD